MVTLRWTTSRISVHHPGYHLIFCPNDRRLRLGPSVGHKCWTQVLDTSVGHKCWTQVLGENRERVIVLHNEKAVELAVKTESVEVMPNHVHLFVRRSLVLALYFLGGQMKGYTSRNLWAVFSSRVSPLPLLWTCSDSIESVGPISKDAKEKTIEEQRGR